MGSARDKRRRLVRRITLMRPGEEPILLVTDLADERAYPAADLLAAYLTRRQVENCFRQITEVFALDHLIGCSPQATVFQASLCLVIYNVLQVIRGYVAAGRDEPAAVGDLSPEMIFRDLHEEVVCAHKALGLGELLPVLARLSDGAAVGARLRTRLRGVWSTLWKKATNRRPRPHRPKAKQSGAHTSVHKVLQEAKQNRQIKPSPKRL